MKESKVMWILSIVVLIAIFIYSIFFSSPTYNVTFDTNGGNVVEAQELKKNDVATKPADPVREGYTFKEWQVDGKAYDFTSKVTSNVTIKAVWEEKPTTTTKKTTTKKTTTKKTTTKKTTTTKKK